ncbi:MAG: TonB-dependent receptor plug domain-containing protein [Chitinophagaceae bacterium]|nr:TonB-dependent receptor plug domain-containing protein [Chitinophagaceae bacterium]
MACKRIYVLLLFFTAALVATAQNDLSPRTWFYIDTTIASKRNLNDLDNIVSSLHNKAIQEKNYLAAARCIMYRINIADLRTEDSLYFKNSAIIDTLLSNNQPPLYSYALHLLQAKRLTEFKKKYLRYGRNKYERKDIPVNYALYNFLYLDSIASIHYTKAKTAAGNVGPFIIDDALWLSSDPLQFLFKPRLFDIAIAEEIKNLVSNFYGKGLSKILGEQLSVSQEQFITVADSIASADSNKYPIDLYLEWMRHHDPSPGNRLFIETLFRKYVYNIMSNAKNADKLYEQYLQNCLSSPFNTVKAHAVFQLCLLWNSQAAKYFPTTNYQDYDYETRTYKQKGYDSSFRFHAVKAHDLYNRYAPLLDSFQYLNDLLQVMKKNILSAKVSITIQNNNLPGEPFLGTMKFKNLTALHYRIIREKPAGNFVPATNANKMMQELLLLPLTREVTVTMPAVDDHNYHGTFLKIDALPPGQYSLIYSDKPLTDTTAITQLIRFNVTNIAMVNSDKRIYVLHRKTGMPLTGAKVKAVDRRETKRDSTGTYYSEKIHEYTVNNKGFIDLKNIDHDWLYIWHAGDSISEYASIVDPDELAEDVYNKDEYDNLVEYYEENAIAFVYTDRSIYRPGQTVFYKAIFITKHPYTGEPLIMSRENLKGKLFENIYNKWLKDSEAVLYLYDPFGKEMDSIKIDVNEYGSVSGSFKIPKSAATGEWNIEPDYIEKSYQTGSFRVEEYKKPAYEISIEKPKQELKPGDSFSVNVKIRSFAGAQLDNVKVKYIVSRYGALPKFDSVIMSMSTDNKTVDLLDSSGLTDKDGMLKIEIADPLLKQTELDKNDTWIFTYNIEIETSDVTGENYSEDVLVKISSRPVNIRIPLNKVYEKKNLSPVMVSTEDINAGKVDKTVKLKLYRLRTDEKIYSSRQMQKADIWLYEKQKLQQEFPLLDLENTESEETKELVWEKTIHTGKNEKLEWDRSITAGRYSIEAICDENGMITGEAKKNFAVIDIAEKRMMAPASNFVHVPYNSVSPGDTVKMYHGNSENGFYSIYHIAYYAAGKKVSAKYIYQEKTVDKGLQLYNFVVPANAADYMRVTRTFVLNNEVFTKMENISINNATNESPEIIIEKYRKILTPGSKETFSVSIKTKNENVAAELMTTLYDASLDKLEPHKWELAERHLRDRSSYPEVDWTSSINSDITGYAGSPRYYEAAYTDPAHPKKEQQLWWMNPVDHAYSENRPVYGAPGGLDFDMVPAPYRGNMYTRDDVYGFVSGRRGEEMGGYASMVPGANSLFGLSSRLSGVTIANTEGLNEVVVTALGTSVVRRELGFSTSKIAASRIAIRGMASIESYAQPLIIIDGIVFTGDIKTIDTKTITDGIVLKGADATAIYGSRAANGVLVLSTKGEIVFPKEPEPVIIPRKNFNETAFFFPAIYADRQGYYTFSFTMPESVTEWNWKLHAHTKDLLFAYAERKLNTQLPLMVQPNMPRVLYRGDRIVLQSRITNLDTVNISGKIICKIEDAATGEDITAKLLAVQQNDFSLAQRSNIAKPFEIKVPADQLNPLKIIVTIRSANFADGEEHVIPVLSPKIFTRQIIPFTLGGNASITPGDLPADAEVFGAGLGIRDKPNAAMLYSLGYLANYPFGCAEQNFNKILAHSTALMLMRKDTAIQRSFIQAKKAADNDSLDTALPDAPVEEAMPWLSLKNDQVKKQFQLFSLLDTFRTKETIYELTDKIYKMQADDGGLSWFPGGKSNFYISSYVLRGFGKLTAAKQITPKVYRENDYMKFIEKLIKYCDDFYLNLADKDRSTAASYYAYARSFWLEQYAAGNILLESIRKKITEQWKEADSYSLYYQALLCINSIRYANDTVLMNKAKSQLNSISQLAIADEINGTRWKDLSDADDLSVSAEETIGLIAEAFNENKSDNIINEGIVKWLLVGCQEHHWGSTKGTAAALELITKENKGNSGPTQKLKAIVNDKTLDVSDDLISGNNFSFVRSNSLPQEFKIEKEGQQRVDGHVSVYYFTASPQSAGNDQYVSIEKALYKWNDTRSAWSVMSTGETISISDKVKVVLKIRSEKMLEYVYVDDKRAAAFEPEDKSSGYEYSGGLSYYKSIRDAGVQLFIDKIPSGIHEISYELKASQEGSFTNGPVSLQCMYRPDITVYANGLKVNVNKSE